MNKNDKPETLGVFKPVGHVIASFATQDQATDAVSRLDTLGLQAPDIVHYTPQRMIEQVDHDLQNASVLASIGQEVNLVKAHRALAEQGFHFLVIRAPDDELTAKVGDLLKQCGAERAQKYGRLIIEELIEHPEDERQTFESPARGLDAQTPSGTEEERGER